jgi:hypothetical protein
MKRSRYLPFDPDVSPTTDTRRPARLRKSLVVEVTALQSVNENLGLANVSPQRSRLAPDGRCAAVRAGGILTFEPYQPAGHFVQLIAQRADQVQGLGDVACIHERIGSRYSVRGRQRGHGQHPDEVSTR